MRLATEAMSTTLPPPLSPMSGAAGQVIRTGQVVPADVILDAAIDGADAIAASDGAAVQSIRATMRARD